MPLQVRRGTDAERLAMTQPLASGELLYVTNEQRLYIGNGNTLGGVLITGYTDGDAKDSAAEIFTDGVHSGIGFTYNTATNVITATVDLSSYTGTINASAFKGTLVADDSTLLVDAVDGKINLDGTVKGNIIPNTNEIYDIGSASNRFKDLYLSGSSIELGAATITSVGSVVNLPAGSTINGIEILSGSGAGALIGDLTGSVFADNSTMLINGTDGSVNLDGTVKGSITPFANNLYDLGSSGNRFKDLYLESTVRIGTAVINATGSAINLPSNSTANGSTIGTRIGTDDSTIITVSNGGVVSLLGGAGIQTGTNEEGFVTISATETHLNATPQVGETTNHYLTFIDSFDNRALAKVDGDLRYVPSTKTLNSLYITSTDVSVNGPVAASSVVTPFVITNDAELVLYSTLATGALRYTVGVGGGGVSNIDGRFQVITSSRYGDNNLNIVNISQSHAEVDAANFQFNRSRGVANAPTAVNNGDDIVDLTFAGYDGGAYRVKATISATVDGAVSTNVVPTKLTFSTSGTSSGPIEAVSINSIQQTTFSGAIKLAIYADDTARDAAITAPTAGMMVFNTTGTKFQGYTGAAWVDLN
jgi:Major tropism determinant N-terminal domain